MGYLIDSNVLSELRKPKRVEQVAAWFRGVDPSELFTSVLVLAELRRGSLLVRRRDSESASRLDAWISDLEAAFEDRVLAVTAYRRLGSLREYVLIAQRERRVEVYRRDGRRWVLDEYGPGERLQLESISVELAVDELYVDRVGPIVP